MIYKSLWQAHKDSACPNPCHYCAEKKRGVDATRLVRRLNVPPAVPHTRAQRRQAIRAAAKRVSLAPVPLERVAGKNNTAPSEKPTAFQRLARKLRLPFGRGDK